MEKKTKDSQKKIKIKVLENGGCEPPTDQDGNRLQTDTDPGSSATVIRTGTYNNGAKEKSCGQVVGKDTWCKTNMITIDVDDGAISFSPGGGISEPVAETGNISVKSAKTRAVRSRSKCATMVCRWVRVNGVWYKLCS